MNNLYKITYILMVIMIGFALQVNSFKLNVLTIMTSIVLIACSIYILIENEFKNK